MGGHTYSSLHIHVIFSTKDRRPVIHDDVRGRLYSYMAGVARQEFGRALRVGGTDNHLHGLLSLRTDVSVAEAMRKWKSLSSRWIHQASPGSGAFAWQAGYGAFAVSLSKVSSVVAYIDGQAERHKTMTFEEEFIALLERHGIEYDVRYVWG